MEWVSCKNIAEAIPEADQTNCLRAYDWDDRCFMLELYGRIDEAAHLRLDTSHTSV